MPPLHDNALQVERSHVCDDVCASVLWWVLVMYLASLVVHFTPEVWLGIEPGEDTAPPAAMIGLVVSALVSLGIVFGLYACTKTLVHRVVLWLRPLPSEAHERCAAVYERFGIRLTAQRLKRTLGVGVCAPRAWVVTSGPMGEPETEGDTSIVSETDTITLMRSCPIELIAHVARAPDRPLLTACAGVYAVSTLALFVAFVLRIDGATEMWVYNLAPLIACWGVLIATESRRKPIERRVRLTRSGACIENRAGKLTAIDPLEMRVLIDRSWSGHGSVDCTLIPTPNTMDSLGLPRDARIRTSRGVAQEGTIWREEVGAVLGGA